MIFSQAKEKRFEFFFSLNHEEMRKNLFATDLESGRGDPVASRLKGSGFESLRQPILFHENLSPSVM